MDHWRLWYEGTKCCWLLDSVEYMSCLDYLKLGTKKILEKTPKIRAMSCHYDLMVMDLTVVLGVIREEGEQL
jgi:hypothetical protein